jgi:RNA polymerase sigma-70 factor, ECF subfamily
MDEQPESEVVAPTQNGKDEAEHIVRDNIDWMLSLSYRILNDHTLAQDAVQDAFLDAFRALDKFEGRSSLKTWLHRITVNACLKKLRQNKRLAEQSIDDLLPEFDSNNCRIEARWEDLASVEQLLEKDNIIDTVRTKIFELPDTYRIVLQLRDIEGYSIKEVVDLLEISESNVKVRLHRARAALKKLLEPILRGDA